MKWVLLVVAIIIFVTSCIGLGYLTRFWVRHRQWPGWASGLTSLAAALLWPIIVVGYIIFDARRYQSQHPHDDAPGMVVASTISVGAPLLFLLSLSLVVIGLLIADRRNAKGH